MAKRTEKIRLSHAEKQQLKALMARRQQQDPKGPRTAQATIPYQRMWPDGICRVTDQYYTKTIRFQDINYQLAQNDDKTAIFEGWCDFLNYFDNSIHLQFSFLNLTASKEVFEQSILIPDREDGNDEIRHEYADMLQTQQAKGNNGLTKTKFITFGIEAEGIKAAKPRLERIEIDLLNNFKRLGVAASPLDGRERLKLMHDMFHMDTQAPFLFDWKWLAPSGLSTKDFIAPSSFDFRDKRTFGMGKKQAEVSFFSILASDLNDRCLADFLAMESSLVVSLHIRAIDQIAAIRDVKRKITDLDKMKIEEQKKAVRAGYDMDIIPSDLATYGGEAKKLLEDLQSRNERMFLITFLVMNTADDKKQLALNVKQAQSLAQQHNCQLIPLDFQQENGMVSCLPLGHNLVRIQRSLTTSSTAIFVPFTVIREPANQSVTYDQWLGENAGISQRDILRMTIDAALRMRPDGFDALMQLLEEAGCRIKRAAQISIRPPGGKRFIRLDTLGPEYTEAVLEASLSGQRVHIPKRSRTQYTRKQIELLIDIEAKLRTGKGKGYERWAEKHNIDTLASSMIYLKENHIGSYADLTQKIQLALDSRNGLKDQIREAQRRMQEISAQRKAIWVYSRTRDVYTKYKESGRSPAFYRENKEAIESHKQAQAVYNAADGKLPTLSELSQEYDRLLVQKREAGKLLAQRNEELQSLRHIKKNLDTLLADEHFALEQPFKNEKKPREHDQRTEKTGR